MRSISSMSWMGVFCAPLLLLSSLVPPSFVITNAFMVHPYTTTTKIYPFPEPRLLLQATSCTASTRTTTLYNSPNNNNNNNNENDEEKIIVAVTREDGKNTKLIQQVQSHPKLQNQVEVVELPCIAHADGPDLERLGSVLSSQPWDYVVITSPEAARVLATAWDTTIMMGEEGKGNGKYPPPSVAAVGKATETTLASLGIPVSFTPSKATAKTLAAELQRRGKDKEITTVLYPASARAQNTLQIGLEELRNDDGFVVTRLNTYDTVTATWNTEQQELAQKVRIVCFASPSSIKGWLANTNNNNHVLAACIGETSAKACRTQHDWIEDDIFYPENPGLDGWVDAIAQAATAAATAAAQEGTSQVVETSSSPSSASSS